jgi:hypothetical protein
MAEDKRPKGNDGGGKGNGGGSDTEIDRGKKAIYDLTVGNISSMTAMAEAARAGYDEFQRSFKEESVDTVGWQNAFLVGSIKGWVAASAHLPEILAGTVNAVQEVINLPKKVRPKAK